MVTTLSPRREAEELADTSELLRAVIDNSPFATLAFDEHENLVLWSAGAERLFGWTAEEVVGRPMPDEMIPTRDRVSSQDRIRRTLAGATIAGDLVVRRTKAGRDVMVEIHAGPLHDADGRTVGFAGHLVDVTRLIEAEHHLALIGRVRSTLADAVGRVRADTTVTSSAQAICDELRRLAPVDFAAVGLFAGHDAAVLAANAEPGVPIKCGDRLPEQRSATLRQKAGGGSWAEAWTAAPEDGPWGEAMTAAGIRAIAFGPIVHGAHVDGGVVIGTRDEAFARTLLEKWAPLIDLSSMPSALLAEGLHAHREERERRSGIADALSSLAFHPVFQPIVELSTRKVVGHEALTRFDSGRRPDQVFADAKAVGLGIDLELATLSAALRDARGLPADLWLDLNVSPWLLEYPGPLSAVLSIADRPVVLEVTEHAAVGNYDAFRTAVRELGNDVRLAVDDAGSGVANFAHIIDLGPDLVKLDRSLVEGVHNHLGRQALIVGMRYFSEASGCPLVAEGIETEGEAQSLANLGVEYGQGYYFGRPERPTALINVTGLGAPSVR
jgi:PAS domain S-box-containing protein